MNAPAGMEVDRGTRGRALFTALGYGWAMFGLFGLLGSLGTLILSLIGAFDSEGQRRPLDPYVAYGFEMGVAGVFVEGATLLSAILFLLRFGLFRGFLEICLWLQLAMLIAFTALHVQYSISLHGAEGWSFGSEREVDSIFGYIGAWSGIYQSVGTIVLATLSLVFIRDRSLQAEFKVRAAQ